MCIGRRWLLLLLVALLAIARSAASASAPALATGSAQGARAYYARFSEELGFDAKPEVSSLDELLEYLGYPISGASLEGLDSAILMSPQRIGSAKQGGGLETQGLGGATLRDGDILSARFFAPKIVNVDASSPVPGWRKLVRLRVRPDSRAARAGVEWAVVLFNFLAPAGSPPFLEHSFNTQVMLIAPSRANHLYWLDFNANQKLSLALNASFDAADLSGNHDYFVPDGCNDCHGRSSDLHPPMVNYLDTDHWFDRLDDDFAPLKEAGTPIVFDAQTNDSAQPSFAPAFDVIRRFNEEALLQNSAVQPNSFETQAARTWLRLHAKSDAHVAPVDRGFASGSKPTWQPTEADGLARLNRYCFRCHGSVRFSIFDRPAVVQRAGAMRQRIQPSKQQLKIPGFKMPPDRVLAPEEVQALDRFLNTLK